MAFNDLPAANRIVCPACGNDSEFLEIAEDVILTTLYVQNRDGSFTPVEDNSQVLGEVKLICAECEEDLTAFHQRFSDMLF
jgi:hypothetical protein